MMTYKVLCDVTRCYATLSRLSLLPQKLKREDVLDVYAYILDKRFVKRCYFVHSHLSRKSRTASYLAMRHIWHDSVVDGNCCSAQQPLQLSMAADVT